MEKRMFRVLLCLFLGLAVIFAGCSPGGGHQSFLPFLLTNLPEQYIIIL